MLEFLHTISPSNFANIKVGCMEFDALLFSFIDKSVIHQKEVCFKTEQLKKDIRGIDLGMWFAWWL